ncbi:hypothetical protein LOS20_12040 [Enterococcus faecium]|nr:hypothetical protein [Enterococcus faecium]
MSSYLLKQKRPSSLLKKRNQKYRARNLTEKKKLSYMEQKEWETIEDEIAELEEKISLLKKR